MAARGYAVIRRRGGRRAALYAKGNVTLSIDPRLLRNAFGQFATGVTIVCSRHGEDIRGMTANSFSSVSLHPPMLLVCIANRARMLSVIEQTGAFSLSVLGSGQRAISDHFARSGDAKEIAFGNFEGMPVIDHALAYFACEVEVGHPAGDHTIFVGKILACAHQGGAPLLFHAGAYSELNS